MEKDLISIIIPTYNRAGLLPKAIDSVLAQTYSNWELIIVDDQSTDHTETVVESYIKNDSRIQYLKNTHQKGPSGARNCGISYAKGTYIAFLDSDDQWLDIHLSESYEALHTFNTKMCVSIWYERKKTKLNNILEMNHLEEKINHAIHHLHAVSKQDFILFDSSFFEYTMTYGIYCYHINTLVAHRALFFTYGTFSETLQSSEDIDLMFRFMIHNNFCLIRKPHFIYNEGTDNIYNFMDRSTVNMKQLLFDKNVIQKLNFCNTNKCKMFHLLIQTLKHSNLSTTELIPLLREHIAFELKSLSYLNCLVSRRKSIHFMMISCRYEYSSSKLSFIFRVLFSRNKSKLCDEIASMNLL